MTDLLLALTGLSIFVVLFFGVPCLIGFVGCLATRLFERRRTCVLLMLLSCIVGGFAANLIGIALFAQIFDGRMIMEFAPEFWLTGIAAAAVGILVGWNLNRSRAKRRGTTRCEQCGYSLRGLTGDPIRCPECGEVQQTESES